jgi:trehalose 6-phosphate phosphatase
MYDQPPPRLDWQATALFLDIDGTLAEFETLPSDVGPEPRRTAVLRRVCERLQGRVAVLSGRSLSEVDRILEAAVGPVAAVHGLVQRQPGGRVETAGSAAGLDATRSALRALAEARPGVLLEDKGLSLAAHYRLAPDAGPAVEALVRRLSEAHGLRVQPGAMVMELRVPGPDKGDALRRFMETPEFAGAHPVMVGDDLTDEPAFEAAAAAGGYGVRVGRRRPTRARYGLPSVEAVLDWLAAA